MKFSAIFSLFRLDVYFPLRNSGQFSCTMAAIFFVSPCTSFSICTKLAASTGRSAVPIHGRSDTLVTSTARDGVAQRVEGLDAGADDYVDRKSVV